MREEILVNLTNGGPVKVHVKDGKIIRVFPLSFDDNDAASWTINAGGRKFSPPRKACTPPFTMSEKARIYSDARIKYPLLREDFSPDGDRHPENRGKSGYKRISWGEALDIVAGEMQRIRAAYGPEAVMSRCSSHHNWGNVGYRTGAWARGIEGGDIVKIYNDRGTVLCIAEVTERIKPGVIHSYFGSGKYDPIEPGNPDSPDRGGCVNILVPERLMSKNVPGMAPNSCLVEIARWEG